MEFIIAVVIGIVIGGLAVQFIMKAKIESVAQQGASSSIVEIEKLKERVTSRDEQIALLQQRELSLSVELKNTAELLKREASLRSAAEEKNSRIPELENTVVQKDNNIESLQDAVTTLKTKCQELETTLIEERKLSEEKLSLLQDAQQKLGDAFKSLSAEALKTNNQSFIDLAKQTLEQYTQAAQTDIEARKKAIDQLVQPLQTSLEKVDTKIQDLEKERVSAYSSITEQLKSLAGSQVQLQAETSNLVKALRQPTVRGRWGEIQLRRVVELAGMVEYCDFVEQESVNVEGGRLRPDLLVNLPNGKRIIVDAKAPLSAYIESFEAKDDETKHQKLVQHAAQIKTHLNQLSAKQYWDQFDQAPEFVVLFIPGESFFSAALEQDSGLIEYGAERKVILATPTTLIALLKAVAYGWRQAQLERNAQEISKIGKELYDRIRTFVGHFSSMRKSLEGAVESYNKAVGSLETRVLTSARKFRELGASTADEIETIEDIDVTPRQIQKEE